MPIPIFQNSSNMIAFSVTFVKFFYGKEDYVHGKKLCKFYICGIVNV